MFAAAGLQPPTTWEELVAAAKKLTKPAKGVYGMAMEGGSYTEGVHFASSSAQQHGADPFDSSGKPQFTTPRHDRRRQAVRRPDGGQQGRQPERRAVQERPRGARRLRQGQGRDADEPEQREQHAAGRRHEVQPSTASSPSRQPRAARRTRPSFVAGHQPVDLQEHQEQGRRAEVREVHDQQGGAGDPRQAVHGPAGRQGRHGELHRQPRRGDRPSATCSRPAGAAAAGPAEAAYETNVGNAVKQLLAQRRPAARRSTTQTIKAALQEAQDKMASAGS